MLSDYFLQLELFSWKVVEKVVSLQSTGSLTLDELFIDHTMTIVETVNILHKIKILTHSGLRYGDTMSSTTKE